MSVCEANWEYVWKRASVYNVCWSTSRNKYVIGKEMSNLSFLRSRLLPQLRPAGLGRSHIYFAECRRVQRYLRSALYIECQMVICACESKEVRDVRFRKEGVLKETPQAYNSSLISHFACTYRMEIASKRTAGTMGSSRPLSGTITRHLQIHVVSGFVMTGTVSSQIPRYEID